MKVYNKVVIDIATGDIIEEDSFEYHGPVVRCEGGGDGGGYGSYMDADLAGATPIPASDLAISPTGDVFTDTGGYYTEGFGGAPEGEAGFDVETAGKAAAVGAMFGPGPAVLGGLVGGLSGYFTGPGEEGYEAALAASQQYGEGGEVFREPVRPTAPIITPPTGEEEEVIGGPEATIEEEKAGEAAALIERQRARRRKGFLSLRHAGVLTNPFIFKPKLVKTNGE